VHKRASRRGFLRISRDTAVKGLGLAAVVAGGGLGTAWLVRNAEQGPPVLTGRPIDNEVRELVTDNHGDFVPLLRSRPSLSVDTEIGIVEVDIPVKVQRVFGPVYPSDDPTFRIEAEGRTYGVWYQLQEPIPVKKQDGTIEITTGVLAGNFLKLPDKEPQAAK